SLLAQDLDALEELTQGYEGPLKVQLTGPWTLAALVEKPRGDKVLSDHGARRDLAQALAEGVRRHLADVQRRVPGAEVVLQIDEPAFPAVLAGQVRTASGFHRHRSVDLPMASAILEEVLVPGTVVHSCAADVPIGLLTGAGAAGVSLDADLLTAASYDELGTLLDDGHRLFLGVVPTGHTPTATAIADRVKRLLDMLGFGPDEVSEQLVLTPACGLAGVGEPTMRQVLASLREAADLLNRG
ncbi:MAG: methionine synthase, partial [Myxococcales bacterium]